MTPSSCFSHTPFISNDQLSVKLYSPCSLCNGNHAFIYQAWYIHSPVLQPSYKDPSIKGCLEERGVKDDDKEEAGKALNRTNFQSLFTFYAENKLSHLKCPPPHTHISKVLSEVADRRRRCLLQGKVQGKSDQTCSLIPSPKLLSCQPPSHISFPAFWEVLLVWLLFLERKTSMKLGGCFTRHLCTS